MKRTLQQCLVENGLKSKLMTAAECLHWLDWSSEKDLETDGETGTITCDCGGQVKTGGFIGVEHAWCPDCKKGMQDMTGFLPVGENCGGLLDFEDAPGERRWIHENVWGFSN